MAEDPRKTALDKTLQDITKRFGEGAIMKLGDSQSLAVDVIPTGTLSLDIALGVGGVPRGRVTEIYGPEASGKTTICQHIVAEAQRQGGTAAFIDMEHALDPSYAARTGVDILEIAESLIRSGAVDVIVIDSVAALVPRAEIEGDMGDSHMGLMARLMSQALRKLSGAIKQTNTCLIFTNQLREKIGVVFGNPETTPGGRALKFYSSVRMDVRRIQSIKSGTDIIGGRIRVRVVKNKVAPPFKTAEFDIMKDGISRNGDILDLAVELGVVDKRGSFYYYSDDLRIAQGRENAKEYLNENPEIAHEIEGEIRSLVMELDQLDPDMDNPEVFNGDEADLG